MNVSFSKKLLAPKNLFHNKSSKILQLFSQNLGNCPETGYQNKVFNNSRFSIPLEIMHQQTQIIATQNITNRKITKNSKYCN